MYKVLVAFLLFIVSCSNASAATGDAADVLNIDNPIVYFDLIGNTPCFPFLLDDNNAYYCSDNDTIYYGNQLTANNPPAIKYFVLAHEDGHSEDDYFYLETVFMQEQFADCFGGVRMSELYDRQYIGLVELQQIINFIYALPAGDHGTPQQRFAAFAYGYLHGDCGFGIL